MIDAMQLWCSERWASNQACTNVNYIAKQLTHKPLVM